MRTTPGPAVSRTDAPASPSGSGREHEQAVGAADHRVLGTVRDAPRQLGDVGQVESGGLARRGAAGDLAHLGPGDDGELAVLRQVGQRDQVARTDGPGDGYGGHPLGAQHRQPVLRGGGTGSADDERHREGDDGRAVVQRDTDVPDGSAHERLLRCDRRSLPTVAHHLSTVNRSLCQTALMTRTQRLVGLLRALLVLAFLALLAAQLRVLPATYDDLVRDDAALDGLGWLLVVAELGLLGVQVVVVCTFRLLRMVADDQIFSDAALVWVNTIVGSIVGTSALLGGACVAVLLRGGRPGLTAALLLVSVAAAVLGLLMVVMRALLRQATTLRVEMDAVV